MDDERNRALEALLDMLAERMRTSADTTGAFGRVMTSAEKELRKLETKVKTATDGIKDLKEGIDDGSKSALENVQALRGFESMLKQSGHGIDLETQQRINSIKIQATGAAVVKGFTDTLQVATTSMIDFAISGFKTLVTELQGNGNAFKTYTLITKQGIDAQNKVNQSIAQAGETIGAVLGVVLPGYFKLLGIAVIGVAKLFGYMSEKSADLEKFNLDVLNEEIHKTIKVFNDNSKAGIFFGNGMSSLVTELKGAGVSYRDFFGALKGSSADLAMLGGNAGAGAAAVKNTFIEMKKYRSSLLNLGITTEEQIQGTAEYMAMLARSGSLQNKTSSDLAKATESYLVNLKVISSITGEDAKAAQARARKEADKFAVQERLAELQGDARTKFEAGIAMMPTQIQGALGQLLGDARTVTNQETAKFLSQVPKYNAALQQFASDVEDSSVSVEEARRRYYKSLADPALADEVKYLSKTLGFASLYGGQYNTEAEAGARVMQDIRKVQAGQALDAENRITDQKNTTDALTTSVTNATLKFNDLQAALEENILKVLPNFAKLVDGQITELSEKFATILAYLSRAAGSNVPATLMKEGAKEGVGAGVGTLGVGIAGGIATGEFVGGVVGGLGAGPLGILVGQALGGIVGGYAGSKLGEWMGRKADKDVLDTGTRDVSGKIKYPEKADGGVVTTPSIAGEAGPEAVIPLKNGSIPVTIDLGPMLSALNHQASLTKDMLREMSDMRDLQSRLLEASY